MSGVALQRVVARLLYDPALVERLYSGFPVPEISEDQRALLLKVDRRAWGTDPYRRGRALTSLLEEFPASAALAGVHTLDPFFSSTDFHNCVQRRGLLALAFGAWIARRVGPVAHLETAFAAARRATRPRGAGLITAPGVVSLALPAGTLERLNALRARLGPDPLGALAAGGLALAELRGPLGPEPAWLLVERGADGGVGVGAVSEALGGLLRFTATPRAREEVLAEARRHGADPGEDSEILDGLIEDGLLIALDAPSVQAMPPEEQEPR